MTETKLYDLTETNLRLEMWRDPRDPLADPGFVRHVSRATTADERERTAERLRRVRRAA